MRSSTHRLNVGEADRKPVPRPADVRTPVAANVISFRAAIEDLVAELTTHTEPLNLAKAERVLLDRVDQPELSAVLRATPKGIVGAVGTLLAELRRFHPDATGFAGDITDLVRIFLRSQIDAMWWGTTRPFQTDAELLGSPELVDLEELRRRQKLRFHYRRQPANFTARVMRAAERRLWPARTPHTAGVRFCHTRPEAVVLLNQVATELARVAPDGTPPPWVTSMARSVAHQHRLRSLGYPAVLPSSHCVGYAVDVEMAWFRRFRADRALACLLLERQDNGDANIIDEGQVWHVCVNPAAAARLRGEFDADAGA